MKKFTEPPENEKTNIAGRKSGIYDVKLYRIGYSAAIVKVRFIVKVEIQSHL